MGCHLKRPKLLVPDDLYVTANFKESFNGLPPQTPSATVRSVPECRSCRRCFNGLLPQTPSARSRRVMTTARTKMFQWAATSNALSTTKDFVFDGAGKQFQWAASSNALSTQLVSKRRSVLSAQTPDRPRDQPCRAPSRRLHSKLRALADQRHCICYHRGGEVRGDVP